MKPFVFKQFEIAQDKCAMKVGTDAVLLGAWANVHNANTILDIGTGTGILALMLAQKNTTARITAIDIDAGAVAQAQYNFEQSKFTAQLTVQHVTLQQYAQQCGTHYDVIISNPPFFENSSRAHDTARNLARHNDTLTLTELIVAVNTLLTPNGMFYVVLPAAQEPIVASLVTKHRMYIAKIMYIHTKEYKAPKRILIAVSKRLQPLTEEHLIIELDARHQYSNEYKALTSPYYVRF